LVPAGTVAAISQLSSARETENRWWYSSVDSSVVGYSPESNDVSTEAEESPLLRSITKQRLLKTLQAGENLQSSNLWSVDISDRVILI
jgi:hypothetical protein